MCPFDQPRSIGSLAMLVPSGYGGQAGQARERSGARCPAWRHDGFRRRRAVAQSNLFDTQAKGLTLLSAHDADSVVDWMQCTEDGDGHGALQI